jgi:hypothetical protein
MRKNKAAPGVIEELLRGGVLKRCRKMVSDYECYHVPPGEHCGRGNTVPESFKGLRGRDCIALLI